MNIPQKEAGGQRSEHGRAVAGEGDDFIQVFDLQAVIKGVANAVREMEKRNGTEYEQIDTHRRMRNKRGGGCVIGGFCPAKRERYSLKKKMHRDQKGSDNTARAEKDPQQRLES